MGLGLGARSPSLISITPFVPGSAMAAAVSTGGSPPCRLCSHDGPASAGWSYISLSGWRAAWSINFGILSLQSPTKNVEGKERLIDEIYKQIKKL